MDLIGDIIETITVMNLDNCISNSLDAKLDAALGALQDMIESNDVAICNSIQALENAINAQTAGKISEDQAAELFAGVDAMQAKQSCID